MLYFTAGVFKIRAVLLNKVQDRVVAAFYVVFSVLSTIACTFPIIILLPLIDNILASASLIAYGSRPPAGSRLKSLASVAHDLLLLSGMTITRRPRSRIPPFPLTNTRKMIFFGAMH
jgi:hypothetical protein